MNDNPFLGYKNINLLWKALKNNLKLNKIGEKEKIKYVKFLYTNAKDVYKNLPLKSIKNNNLNDYRARFNRHVLKISIDSMHKRSANQPKINNRSPYDLTSRKRKPNINDYDMRRKMVDKQNSNTHYYERPSSTINSNRYKQNSNTHYYERPSSTINSNRYKQPSLSSNDNSVSQHNSGPEHSKISTYPDKDSRATQFNETFEKYKNNRNYGATQFQRDKPLEINFLDPRGMTKEQYSKKSIKLENDRMQKSNHKSKTINRIPNINNIKSRNESTIVHSSNEALTGDNYYLSGNDPNNIRYDNLGQAEQGATSLDTLFKPITDSKQVYRDDKVPLMQKFSQMEQNRKIEQPSNTENHVQNNQPNRTSHNPNNQQNRTSHNPNNQQNRTSHVQNNQPNRTSHNPNNQQNRTSHNPNNQPNRTSHNPNNQQNRSSHNPNSQQSRTSHNPNSQQTRTSHNPNSQQNQNKL